MPIKNPTPDVRMDDMKCEFLKHAADLWDKQAEKFMSLLASSDDKKVKLTWGATLDFSESEASLEVNLGFGKRYTDSRKSTFGDPNQGELPIDPEGSETSVNGDATEHEEGVLNGAGRNGRKRGRGIRTAVADSDEQD